MARYYSGNTQPIRSWNNIPIYLSTIITAVFVVNFIVTAICSAVGIPWVMLLFCPIPMSPPWMLWRLFSYVFVQQLSFFTPFSILFFYWAAVGIETHLGRIVLSRLLILLTLVVPAMGAIAWWGFGLPSMAAGDYALLGGLIVAFATLYPNTEAWGWIPFKWMAFACVFCGSLMLLAGHDWLGLAQLWASCAIGFGYMRQAKEQEYDDYESPLGKVKELFRRKPKFRVLPSPNKVRRRAEVEDGDSNVDPLLDKIAKSGMASLTDKEREQLEKAREALMRKDQH